MKVNIEPIAVSSLDSSANSDDDMIDELLEEDEDNSSRASVKELKVDQQASIDDMPEEMSIEMSEQTPLQPQRMKAKGLGNVKKAAGLKKPSMKITDQPTSLAK